MQTRKITSPLSLIFLLSTLGGIAVHFYLTSEHINLKYGVGETSGMCNISDTFSCNTAIISKYSELFGIPLAIFGMFLNLAILFFGAKALIFKTRNTANNARVTLTLSVLSIVATLIMAAISIFILKSFCPFCMAAYAFSFITLVTAYVTMKPALGPLAADIWKPLLMACAFVAIGSFAYGAMALKDFNSKEVKQVFALQIAEWQNAKPTPPELTEPLKFGPDMAKMKVVEYADFLCPHCRVAFNKLHAFAKATPGVQLVFQAFPLDGCAGSAESPGLRCQLAMTAYCAEKQKKGVAAQDFLFNNQEAIASHGSITQAVENLSSAIAVNKDEINTCIRDVATLEVIKKQLEGGKKLGIEGTPAIFINDKKFRGGLHLPLMSDIYNSL